MSSEQTPNITLPTDTETRKTLPMATGVLDYFPAALAAVAKLSKVGNDKHNPGLPLHWSRGKSSDHADCILRHLVDRGTIDPADGLPHSAKVAWRALALLQEELEAAGAPLPRGAWAATPAPAPKPVWVDDGITNNAPAIGAPRWKCSGCGNTEQWTRYFDSEDSDWVRATADRIGGRQCSKEGCLARTPA